MNNDQYKVFSLENLIDIIIKSKYYVTTFTLIVILLLFVLNSFSFYLGMIIGIAMTLIIEILFVYYFFGLSSNDIPTILPNILESPEVRPISNLMDIEDLLEVAEEENKNDVRILYKSICHRDEEIVNKLYIDQNFYCNCKFNPENIITIAKMRGDTAYKFTQNIVCIFNLAYLFCFHSIIFKKYFSFIKEILTT